MSKTETIEGWVARDADNRLRLHYAKPKRVNDYWQSVFKDTYLPEDMYSDLTFENSPRKCKLTIQIEEDGKD